MKISKKTLTVILVGLIALLIGFWLCYDKPVNTITLRIIWTEPEDSVTTYIMQEVEDTVTVVDSVIITDESYKKESNDSVNEVVKYK